MNFLTEKAKEEDLAFLFVLNKELIDQYEDTASIDYEQVLRWVKRNLTASISSFRRIIVENKLAGFYCLSPDEDKWELDSLFILPEFQNKGIGTAILNSCIAEASGRLFLYVFRKNTRAVKLYERTGFSVAQVLPTRFIMEYRNPCV